MRIHQHEREHHDRDDHDDANHRSGKLRQLEDEREHQHERHDAHRRRRLLHGCARAARARKHFAGDLCLEFFRRIGRGVAQKLRLDIARNPALLHPARLRSWFLHRRACELVLGLPILVHRDSSVGTVHGRGTLAFYSTPLFPRH